MKFLTAAISLVAVVIGVYGRQRKDLLVLSVMVPGLLLLLSILPSIGYPIRAMLTRRRQMRFVKSEFPRLLRFYQRLPRYVDQNDGRSLRNILYSASAYRHDVVDSLLGSDYISTWIECFGRRLNLGTPNSFSAFMHSCNEFTAILNEYNRHYAIRIQRGIEKTPIDQDHIIDQLEQFREDFNQYLREIEEWSSNVTAGALKVEPTLYSHVQICPSASFEKVKTFRKVKGATS
jgi:hypothetical protein